MTPPVTNPDLTVLMAVYNQQTHVARAITSILTQTLRDVDFLIVDDGSTDATPDILARHAAAESRIRLLTLPQNGGLAAALQAGLAATDATFVARMDSDDISCPERLAIQLATLRGSRLDILGAGQTRGPRGLLDIWPALSLDHGTIIATLPRRNVLAHPSVMFRRAVIGAAGGYDPRFKLAQDYDLWLRLIGQARFGNLGRKLVVSPTNCTRASGPANRQRHTVFSVTAATNHFLRARALTPLDPSGPVDILGLALAALVRQSTRAEAQDIIRHAIRLVRYASPAPPVTAEIRDAICEKANLHARMKWRAYALGPLTSAPVLSG
ncbi:hypothetical protein HYN69_04070 [Gemmobacter aquarius]|uniref:Glycosyltransferase 2-like domain-containing protein n=1 Tax=Paragemmobacter aquarius TaxID=2169400 RepID=A0A2S0UIZ7_9RHOB|nr:hypothetical protein HYN69_04070 [Gemmobacter aquarius]